MQHVDFHHVSTHFKHLLFARLCSEVVTKMIPSRCTAATLLTLLLMVRALLLSPPSVHAQSSPLPTNEDSSYVRTARGSSQ